MSGEVTPLSRLLTEVEAAKTKLERMKIVAAWMDDAEQVQAAAEMDELELDAWLMRIGGVSAMSQAVRLMRRRIDRERGPGPELRVVDEDDAQTVDVDGEVYDLPYGYWVGPGGSLLRAAGDDRPPIIVAHRIVLAVSRWTDPETGREVVDLTWARPGGGWHTETVHRAVVADSRRLIELSDVGCPVASTSAAEVVRYLRAQVEGLRVTPGVAVSRCGWVGREFVVGLSTLGGEEVRVIADEGARQIARGIGTSGTWEGWVEAIRPVSDRPLVMMAIYGAVASMMLRPLGVQGGIVLHWSARTSQGKTSALRAAASVVGDPMAAGLVGSWDATMKKIEEQASFCCDMPTMLDETSHIAAHAREGAARLVYALASGRGRGRGTRGGSEAVAEYRTVALSTGESPLTSWCSQEGIAARVLEMSGAPCASASQSQALVWGVSDHYGHLGRRVIEWLAGRDWPALRARYRERVAHWSAQAETGGVAARLGELVALLEAAARLCGALGVPGDVDAHVAWAWALSQRQAAGADEGLRALEVVRAGLAAHADQVQRPGAQSAMVDDDEGGRTSSGRCIARDMGDGTVAVSSVVVDEWWARAGLDPASMRQRWQDRGWLSLGRTYLLGQRVRTLTVSDDW